MKRGRAAGGRPPGRAQGLLTPTASLKQEDLGVASQCPAVAQLLHKHLQLPLLPVSPQELPLRPPVGHEGHKGTAHRAPVGVQPLPELGHLLLESLGGGMRSGRASVTACLVPGVPLLGAFCSPQPTLSLTSCQPQAQGEQDLFLANPPAAKPSTASLEVMWIQLPAVGSPIATEKLHQKVKGHEGRAVSRQLSGKEPETLPGKT